jgi:hypothetical protein
MNDLQTRVSNLSVKRSQRPKSLNHSLYGPYNVDMNNSKSPCFIDWINGPKIS